MFASRAGSGEEEQELLSRLVSTDWRDRRDVIEVLSARATRGELDRLSLARALIRIVREEHNNMSALNSSIQMLGQIGQQVSAELLNLLHDDDLDLRIYVPLVLGHLDGEEVTTALMEAAVDPSQPENVRFNAIEALGMLQSGNAVPVLLRILANESDFLRYGAVSSLGAIGRQEAAPALELLLDDPYLAEPAVLALGSCGSVENIPAICSWLARSPGGRRVAVSAIGAIVRRSTDKEEARQAFLGSGCQNAREILLGLAVEIDPQGCHESETIWADLALLLGWFLFENPEDVQVSSALVTLLGCKPARPGAAAALIDASGPVSTSLVQMAQEADTDKALAAVHVLAGMATQDAFEPLLSIVHSEDEALAITALQGIGKILDRVAPSDANAFRGAVEKLFDLLNSSRVSIRQAAVKVLSTLHDWGVEDRAVDLLNHPEHLSRASSLQLLAKMNPQAALRAAVDARNDPAPEVRRIAIEMLPRSIHPQAVELLRQALNDPDAGCRRTAAQACVELPGELSLPLLAQAARDPDRWVRLQAGRGLGQVSMPGSINNLTELIKDPFPPVRAAAVEAAARLALALGREWLPDILEILYTAKKDEDASVSQAGQAGLRAVLSMEQNE